MNAPPKSDVPGKLASLFYNIGSQGGGQETTT